MIGAIVLLLVLLSMACLVGCAVIAAQPKENRDAQLAKDWEAAGAKKREQMKKLGISHIYERHHYKPAAAYLAPERVEQPKPSNCVQMRRKK